MIHHNEHSRLWAYVLVALTALLAGLFLGRLSQSSSSDSPHGDWPHIVR